MTRNILLTLVWICLIAGVLAAQSTFQWPVTPFNQNHEITGTFCEYRSTSANGHFHNGTDIPKADGSPVYSVLDGTVISLSRVGSSAFVRVGNFAYVHIAPAASISVGDSVFAGTTVLGTILSGLGHVHFTNGFVGSERNSMRSADGFTPLLDNWAPIIRSVDFYQNNSDTRFTGTEISGLVDIIVKVDEQNGPPSTSLSRRNNGTYKIGYQVLSADSDSVVFSPTSTGLKFQFDTKPSNSVVNTVFYRPLSSTTSHTYQVTNTTAGDSFWNTAAIPEDDYVVMVFVEDTRGNTDTTYTTVTTTEADFTPPKTPVLRYVAETDSGMIINWTPNNDEDLLGYQLDFSFDNVTWTLFRDEGVLTDTTQEIEVKQILNQQVFFRLKALDTAPLANESAYSDVYGMSNGDFSRKVLIVDGFDRLTGGYSQSAHDFMADVGEAVIALGTSFDTYSNEALLADSLLINNYAAVLWMLGDESTTSETFSAEEQTLLTDYLDGGGRLFVSGSEVARDLDPDANPLGATADDEFFLNNYLKADYAGIDSVSGHADGVMLTNFETLDLDFGLFPYQIVNSDIVAPVNNGEGVLTYSDSTFAGIAYDGESASPSEPFRVVYFAFPFETISTVDARRDAMTSVLGFFDQIGGVEIDAEPLAVDQFHLLPNYPNPFNPSTTVVYVVPERSQVRLEIFNLLGQRVRVLEDQIRLAGQFNVVWDGKNTAGVSVGSGLYLVRLTGTSLVDGRSTEHYQKMLLVK